MLMIESNMAKFFSPNLRLNKIKNLSSIKQIKEEEGFTLVELIVVVMMIGILSSIAIPQFMTAADKAKQKEATGIVAALVKGAQAYQTEYGSLPVNAGEISEYARFQECNATGVGTRGGAVCKVSTTPPPIGPVPAAATTFYTTSGNYFIQFQIDENATDANGDTTSIFQVKADPNGTAFRDSGSAVMGCFNPKDATSEIYEFTAALAQRGPRPANEWRSC